MATWIAHLRVAENLLREGLKVEKKAFVAGNIAPDSGVPKEDRSGFEPSAVITHWKDESGKIKPENFYDRYLHAINPEEAKDPERYSFLLGYYVHLLTDVEWSKVYQRKREESLYKENLDENPEFIWEIKKDWYGLDFKYLQEHRESIFFHCFQHLLEVEDYLDYFPKGAFNSRFKYIREMYLKNLAQKERDFIYLSEREMDAFVVEATRNIQGIFAEKDRAAG